MTEKRQTTKAATADEIRSFAKFAAEYRALWGVSGLHETMTAEQLRDKLSETYRAGYRFPRMTPSPPSKWMRQ